MDAIIRGTLRELLESEFSDSQGKVIEYKQLQVENIDPQTNAITINRISVQRVDWDSLSKIGQLKGFRVSVEADIQNNSGKMRTVLAGPVIKIEQAVKAA